MMPNHWRVGFENGNSLTICSLQFRTYCFPPKDSADFAYPGGRNPLPFKTAGVFIMSQKKIPSPVPMYMEYFIVPSLW
jgi:hypothetical protein